MQPVGDRNAASGVATLTALPQRNGSTTNNFANVSHLAEDKNQKNTPQILSSKENICTPHSATLKAISGQLSSEDTSHCQSSTASPMTCLELEASSDMELTLALITKQNSGTGMNASSAKECSEIIKRNDLLPRIPISAGEHKNFRSLQNVELSRTDKSPLEYIWPPPQLPQLPAMFAETQICARKTHRQHCNEMARNQKCTSGKSLSFVRQSRCNGQSLEFESKF